jgi:single-stranded-DNA-specific exonuclease
MIIRQRDSDPVAQQALVRSGVHPVLARVFAARNVRTPEELDESLEALARPGQMANLSQAAAWLGQMILSNKKILVVADYDADGATACAVAIRGLRRFGARVDYLVPDRFSFGYGLTPSLIDHAVKLHAQEPIDLIITVDNGISSIAGVAHAKSLGLEVLITDHHLPGQQLPNTLIVNPNLPHCEFPSKNLAGVGVMFYVLMALRAWCRDQAGWPAQRLPRLDDLLPIVALGTIADVVRLDANNRRLVAQGLRRLRKGNSFAGLNALFQVSNIEVRQANARHFGFVVGPRINAAGRISDMSIGIRCLLEDDPSKALEIAGELDRLNRERREIESEARETAALQAVEILESTKQEALEKWSLVLHHPDWHQGVIGLIAGRLKEKFYRPTIVLAQDSDASLLKGSGRSIPGIHLRDVLERIDTQHPGMMRAFGGHAMAAGLTLARDHLERFTELFESTVREFADPADLQQTLDVDGPLSSEFIRIDVAQMLGDQVWGQGFPAPVFINEFEVLSQRRLKDEHLKLSLRLIENGPKQTPIEAIWFNAEKDLGGKARLAYRLAINDWQGRSSVQLEVVGLA